MFSTPILSYIITLRNVDIFLFVFVVVIVVTVWSFACGCLGTFIVSECLRGIVLAFDVFN